MNAPLATFALAALFLFASHALPSAPGIRPALIRRLGRRAFVVLYSALSLLALAGFVWAYRRIEDNPWLYEPVPGAATLATLLMPLAALLVVARVSTPYGEAAAPREPVGIYRVCRFPGSLGLLLWAGLHLLATGDARRVILFVTMVAIALYAMAKNALVLARSEADAARRFRQTTGIFPFAAILAGNQRFRPGEIGWRRLLAALAAYLALILGHPHVLGVDPLHWLS